MIDFILRKRWQDALKSAWINFTNTLSCSINLSMELGRFEVSFDSFLMSSGEVMDAPEI